MPELITVLPSRKSRCSMVLLFACQNVGVLLGYALLLGIAIFEHSFAHSGSAAGTTTTPSLTTTAH